MATEYLRWEDPKSDKIFLLAYEHDFLIPGGQPHYKQVEANIARYGAMDIRWSWDDILTRYIDMEDEMPTSLPSPEAVRRILQRLWDNHDCEMGVTWYHIDNYLSELEDHELLPVVAEEFIEESSNNGK